MLHGKKQVVLSRLHLCSYVLLSRQIYTSLLFIMAYRVYPVCVCVCVCVCGVCFHLCVPESCPAHNLILHGGI